MVAAGRAPPRTESQAISRSLGRDELDRGLDPAAARRRAGPSPRRRSSARGASAAAASRGATRDTEQEQLDQRRERLTVGQHADVERQLGRLAARRDLGRERVPDRGCRVAGVLEHGAEPRRCPPDRATAAPRSLASRMAASDFTSCTMLRQIGQLQARHAPVRLRSSGRILSRGASERCTRPSSDSKRAGAPTGRTGRRARDERAHGRRSGSRRLSATRRSPGSRAKARHPAGRPCASGRRSGDRLQSRRLGRRSTKRRRSRSAAGSATRSTTSGFTPTTRPTQLAQSVSARAFTTGSDVYFAQRRVPAGLERRPAATRPRADPRRPATRRVVVRPAPGFPAAGRPRDRGGSDRR